MHAHDHTGKGPIHLHDRGTDRLLRDLAMLADSCACPCCGEGMQYVEPQAPEPEHNIGGHPGGWECVECGFTDEFEPEPEPDRLPEYGRDGRRLS